jgi:hypothetical protein
MDRVTTKLEILNENFFINAFKLLEDDSLILVARKNDETTGAAYIIMESDRITFLLVGIDYGYKNHHKVLMNLLYGIVSVAIKSGCRMIDLGQTSYELKQRIGGKCTKEYFFLKSSNGIVNILFRLLRPIIFPIIQTRKRRVFNSP